MIVNRMSKEAIANYHKRLKAKRIARKNLDEAIYEYFKAMNKNR